MTVPQAAVATAEALNPLIVESAPSDTIHKCADVLDFIGEASAASEGWTAGARAGLENIAAVTAAALRFEAERVWYKRKGQEQQPGPKE